MLYNNTDAMTILGAICNDLDIIRSRRFNLKINDFDNLLHKAIFLALNNMALESTLPMVTGLSVDTYLRQFPIQHSLFVQNKGVQYVNGIMQMDTTPVDICYNNFKKMSLLRRYKSIGMDVSGLFDENEQDVVKMEEQLLRFSKMSVDSIRLHFKEILNKIDLDFQTITDAYSIDLEDVFERALDRCGKQNSWGAAFQSKLFNAVFRGMQGSKLFIRSGGTGSGKSRQSIGDMCNIAVEERYIPDKKVWVKNNHPEDVVFISTELTGEELATAMLSTVAGVPEETIKTGTCKPEEMDRVLKAKGILENSRIHCEYTSNFTISEIENIIEKNVVKYKVQYIFFDYIQITPSLSQELLNLFGYVLREDQMLNQLSTALKNLANKYDVFILTSTQVNRNYKSDSYLDATHLRGGQATLDKADYGVITMKVTNEDIKRLQYVIQSNFGKVPTHGQHVIKNRGGKWVGIIIWVKMDLDTMNVEDCFVTTQDYEGIQDIQPIEINN